MKGLEPASQAWNSSAPANIVKSRVPAYIQSLFEQRLHGDGMNLRDLAVFATTLSGFVHNEAISNVMDLFKHSVCQTTETVRSGGVDNVVISGSVATHICGGWHYGDKTFRRAAEASGVAERHCIRCFRGV